MKHGMPKRIKQRLAAGGPNGAALPPTQARRLERDGNVGNQLYEYVDGQNFIFVTGRVIKPPRIVGKRTKEFVWFRMRAPNPDNPGQNLFVSVRARAALGYSIWENIGVGDLVAVVGRLYSAKVAKGQFNYIVAERVSGSFPVHVERDRRFVRVRVDLWNRITKVVGDVDLLVVPPKVRRDLLELFGKQAGWEDDVEEEVASDRAGPYPTIDRTKP